MAGSRETEKLACFFHQTGIWPLFPKQLLQKENRKREILCLSCFANVVNYIALCLKALLLRNTKLHNGEMMIIYLPSRQLFFQGSIFQRTFLLHVLSSKV